MFCPCISGVWQWHVLGTLITHDAPNMCCHYVVAWTGEHICFACFNICTPLQYMHTGTLKNPVAGSHPCKLCALPLFRQNGNLTYQKGLCMLEKLPVHIVPKSGRSRGSHLRHWVQNTYLKVYVDARSQSQNITDRNKYTSGASPERRLLTSSRPWII